MKKRQEGITGSRKQRANIALLYPLWGDEGVLLSDYILTSHFYSAQFFNNAMQGFFTVVCHGAHGNGFQTKPGAIP